MKEFFKVTIRGHAFLGDEHKYFKSVDAAEKFKEETESRHVEIGPPKICVVDKVRFEE